jgi:hypothetical protein
MVMTNQNKLEQLVEEFADSVKAQREVALTDSIAATRYSIKSGNAAKELLTQGEEGLSAFAKLLTDPRIEVRTTAAAYLIPFKTNESIAVLKFSAEGKGIVALGAIMALKRWEEEHVGVNYECDQNILEHLIIEFTDSVVAWREMSEDGDAKAANKFAAKYHNAAKELINYARPGIHTFSRLLREEPRIEVRVKAAGYLIPFKTDEAIAALKFAAEGTGSVALEAKETLKRWEKEGKGVTFD